MPVQPIVRSTKSSSHSRPPADLPVLGRYPGLGRFGCAQAGDKIGGHAMAAHPLGRFVDPADCANAAWFLASDLPSNITGVNLPVDRGLSARLR